MSALPRRIEGNFEFRQELLDDALTMNVVAPDMTNAVVLDLTNGESAGYVMVNVEPGGLFGDQLTYLSPNRARELAFSLLDMADMADLQTGTFSFTHDPFEAALAEQQLTATEQ